MKFSDLKVKKALCSSGEIEIEIEEGQKLSEIIDRGAWALDEAYLSNVVVVQADDGAYYVGDFAFTMRKVSKVEAERVAGAFGDEAEDEDD